MTGRELLGETESHTPPGWKKYKNKMHLDVDLKNRFTHWFHNTDRANVNWSNSIHLNSYVFGCTMQQTDVIEVACRNVKRQNLLSEATDPKLCLPYRRFSLWNLIKHCKHDNSERITNALHWYGQCRANSSNISTVPGQSGGLDLNHKSTLDREE